MGAEFSVDADQGRPVPPVNLMDYFAMAALHGELAAQSNEDGQWSESHFSSLASRCYSIAGAMLKERSKHL